ncbi:MAG: lipoyl(octanoyl) transferase LipB [Desulfobacterota bacterium]|nr:lipoyl(octanoyl) transferase LipB [Thermodesulfobacteriota bacterium]
MNYTLWEGAGIAIIAPNWGRKDSAIRKGHGNWPESRSVCRLDLGLVPYHQAWELQKELVACKRSREDFPEVLLLLEHPPVLTLGRFGRPEHLLADAARLKELGLELICCERGGQVTYHGPGQLIAYPILNLKHLGLGIREVVRRLEEVVMRTLADYRVRAARRPGYPGVWVGEEKIASLGLAIQQNISFHGLALNYGAGLDPFDLINPCGLAGVRMTSLEKIKGHQPVSAELRHNLAGHFMEVFGLEPGTPGLVEKIVEKWLENCKIKTI